MDRNLRRSIVNYSEENVSEDFEMDVSQVIGELQTETNKKKNNKNNMEVNTQDELNLRRQYKKILKSAEERDDWEVVSSKTKPRGTEMDKSNFVYIILHPGIFRILVGIVSKFLNSEYGIILKTGKADRFGVAVTKNSTYYKFPADGKDWDLMLTFYPTNNAFDVKLKGESTKAGTVFIDKGCKTAPSFFVTTILPDLIKHIYGKFDVDKSKTYWKNLAKKGLEWEMKNSNIAKNTRGETKCGHCEKKIGKKASIQCSVCNTMNIVECLTDISESRLRDFCVGNDTFTCNKCIKHIDVETLSINKEVVTQGKVHAIEMTTDQILSVEERNDEKEDNVENENTEPGNESEQQTNEEEVEKEQDVIREKEKGEGNENDNDDQMDKNNEREGTDDQEGLGSRQLECEDNQTGKNNEKAIETEQLVVSEEVSESEKENGGTTNKDQNDMNQGNDHLEANIIEVTNQIKG